MKTNLISKMGALTMALALTLSFAASALADDFAASPKLRESLDSYNRNHSAIATPGGAQDMKCGMCKDELTTRIDYAARGANKPTVTLASHACKMCDTKLTTVGVGKAAKTVAEHACGHGCSVASTN